jgi:hypothetical protein
MVVSFGDEGVKALHRDEFPLGFLGNQRIERASDIRFNGDTQKWDLYIRKPGVAEEQFVLPGPEAMGFDSYNHARDVEVEWLDECLREGCTATGIAGIALLLAIKQRQQETA